MKKLLLILSVLFISFLLVSCKNKTIKKLNELVKKIEVICPKENSTPIEEILDSDFIFKNITNEYRFNKRIIKDFSYNKYLIEYYLETKNKKYKSDTLSKKFDKFKFNDTEKNAINEEITKITVALKKNGSYIEPSMLSIKDKEMIKRAIVIENYNKTKYGTSIETVFDENTKSITIKASLTYRDRLKSIERNFYIGGFSE